MVRDRKCRSRQLHSSFYATCLTFLTGYGFSSSQDYYLPWGHVVQFVLRVCTGIRLDASADMTYVLKATLSTP